MKIAMNSSYVLNGLLNFNEFFQKDVTYDNIKSCKKVGFHSLFKRELMYIYMKIYQELYTSFLFKELAFWGVDELMMEPCCWGNYTQHRDAHKNLKMFDEMHRNSEEEQREKEAEMDEEELENMRRKIREMGTFQKFIMKLRPELWSMLEKPYSSNYAQVLLFVLFPRRHRTVSTVSLSKNSFRGL